MPLGEPWRVGKRPYGKAALSTAAACFEGASICITPHAGSMRSSASGWTDPGCRPERIANRALLGHLTAE